MTPIFFEITVFIVPALVILLGVFVFMWREERRTRKRLEARNRLVQEDRDFNLLREEYDLRKIEATKRILPHQVAEADDPKAAYVRAQQEAMESLFARMIDEGLLAVERSDMPSKPGVEWRVTAWLLDPFADREVDGVNELDDVKADEVLATA